MVIMIVEDQSRAEEALLRFEHKISALTEEEIINMVFDFYDKRTDITMEVLRDVFETQSQILWARDEKTAAWYDPDTESNFTFLVI